MKFKEFAQKIALAVEQRVYGTAEVHEVLKTNGVKRTGLAVTEREACISPLIYLERYYEEFCSGKNFDVIVQDVMEAYLAGKKAEPDVAGFTEWEKARRKVLVKLVNYETNTELLKAVPHRRFLDLAEIYYIVVDIDEGQGMGSILIYNIHLERWGIGEEELSEAAYANYRSYLPAEIKGMGEIVEELAGIRMPQEDMAAMQEMYVATNRWKLNGAAVILFPEMLKGLADRLECDLYILPSSVHEVILLAVRMEKKEELAEIVEEVNGTQVAPEEKLSDTVYRYSRESGRVELA